MPTQTYTYLKNVPFEKPITSICRLLIMMHNLFVFKSRGRLVTWPQKHQLRHIFAMAGQTYSSSSSVILEGFAAALNNSMEYSCIFSQVI